MESMNGSQMIQLLVLLVFHFHNAQIASRNTQLTGNNLMEDLILDFHFPISIGLTNRLINLRDLYGLCEVRQNMTAYTDQEGEKSV